jgi:glutamine phosphoribosylpyrophosphate amidotransferase
VAGGVVGLAAAEEGGQAGPLLGGRTVLRDRGHHAAGEQVVVGERVQVVEDQGWNGQGHRCLPREKLLDP